MNIVGMTSASCIDFKGWSTVLQVSGCIHKCDGCFVKSAGWWKFSAGEPFNTAKKEELFTYLAKPYIDNLVIQGGDSIVPRNIGDTLLLCKEVRERFPSKKIIIFTGYTLAQIKDRQLISPILDYIDYLVDGKYDKKLPRGMYCGSTNQVVWKHTKVGWVKDTGLNKPYY